MAVTLKTVPPTTFVMSSHEGVTIPEISAVSRGVVDDMISDLHAHGVMPLAPVHFIYHGADCRAEEQRGEGAELGARPRAWGKGARHRRDQ